MRKGLKIHTDKISFDKEWHTYTVHLIKGSGEFFIETKDEALEGIFKSFGIKYETWRNYRDVEKAIKKARDGYIESKIEKIAETHKVILFVMEMDYHIKEYDEDGDWILSRKRCDHSMSYRTPPPQLLFDYRIAMKVVMDGEVVRHHAEGAKNDTIHIGSEEKEMPWTQEAENLFKGLHSGLVNLCVKLDDFFGEDNDKVLESIKEHGGLLLEFNQEKSE